LTDIFQKNEKTNYFQILTLFIDKIPLFKL